jgi:hypothetical protein|tara:strand:+ start:35 stop:298 length:264 start_codon:yes stop_codon:yes gene_type:complete
MMTPEEQKYYEDYLSLFIQDGWVQFEKDIQDNLDDYSIEAIKDEGDLRFIQGQRTILNSIKNFRNGIENTYESLQQQEVEVDYVQAI